ncbi:unnamed protein product [Moneuplotes crassus]|uniref:Uncharacterized protein n=2 Tax=Euplotes crassus TaxID=5936 RepID=A0AAD1U2Q1_EUPCR|nr:unnamed protein product [Moneuplotes crassus]
MRVNGKVERTAKLLSSRKTYISPRNQGIQKKSGKKTPFKPIPNINKPHKGNNKQKMHNVENRRYQDSSSGLSPKETACFMDNSHVKTPAKEGSSFSTISGDTAAKRQSWEKGTGLVQNSQKLPPCQVSKITFNNGIMININNKQKGKEDLNQIDRIMDNIQNISIEDIRYQKPKRSKKDTGKFPKQKTHRGILFDTSSCTSYPEKDSPKNVTFARNLEKSRMNQRAKQKYNVTSSLDMVQIADNDGIEFRNPTSKLSDSRKIRYSSKAVDEPKLPRHLNSSVGSKYSSKAKSRGLNASMQNVEDNHITIQIDAEDIQGGTLFTDSYERSSKAVNGSRHLNQLPKIRSSIDNEAQNTIIASSVPMVDHDCLYDLGNSSRKSKKRSQHLEKMCNISRISSTDKNYLSMPSQGIIDEQCEHSFEENSRIINPKSKKGELRYKVPNKSLESNRLSRNETRVSKKARREKKEQTSQNVVKDLLKLSSSKVYDQSQRKSLERKNNAQVLKKYFVNKTNK